MKAKITAIELDPSAIVALIEKHTSHQYDSGNYEIDLTGEECPLDGFYSLHIEYCQSIGFTIQAIQSESDDNEGICTDISNDDEIAGAIEDMVRDFRNDSSDYVKYQEHLNTINR